MGLRDYIKLCTALYGQFEYRPIIKVDPNIYSDMKKKPDKESINIQLQHPENALKSEDFSMTYGYSCFLRAEDGTITKQYKLAPGFRPTMVLLVMEVYMYPYPKCIILQMINNVYSQFINFLF